jgi:hypothetical protein
MPKGTFRTQCWVHLGNIRRLLNAVSTWKGYLASSKIAEWSFRSTADISTIAYHGISLEWLGKFIEVSKSHVTPAGTWPRLEQRTTKSDGNMYWTSTKSGTDTQQIIPTDVSFRLSSWMHLLISYNSHTITVISTSDTGNVVGGKLVAYIQPNKCYLFKEHCIRMSYC